MYKIFKTADNFKQNFTHQFYINSVKFYTTQFYLIVSKLETAMPPNELLHVTAYLSRCPSEDKQWAKTHFVSI